MHNPALKDRFKRSFKPVLNSTQQVQHRHVAFGNADRDFVAICCSSVLRMPFSLASTGCRSGAAVLLRRRTFTKLGSNRSQYAVATTAKEASKPFARAFKSVQIKVVTVSKGNTSPGTTLVASTRSVSRNLKCTSCVFSDFALHRGVARKNRTLHKANAYLSQIQPNQSSLHSSCCAS